MADHGHPDITDVAGHSQPSFPKHASQQSQNPLSCTNCRHRKVKCNRLAPCLPCQRSGLDCIFPERVRHPKKKRNASKATNDELLARLSRMEQLIGRMEADGKDTRELRETSMDTSVHSGSSTDTIPQRKKHETPYLQMEGSESIGDGLNRFIGSSFWRSLTNEVEGLRNTVDNESETEENSPETDPCVSHSSIVFGSTLSSPKDLRLFHPPPTHISLLCNLYMENVDPVFKVLHIPSLRNMVTDVIADVENIPTNNYVEAMLFAMYYAAVTSISPEECWQQFKEGRNSLLARYRAGFERALSNADFLNTQELGILQALSMFLITVRTNDKTQFCWSLTGTTIRLAQGMGLHRESSGANLPPFEQEMRRRMWWQLVILEIRCCEERLSDPLISESTFNTKMPLNINDSDISPGMTHPIVERTGYTELSKCRVSHIVSFITWKFTCTPPAKEGEDSPRMTADEKMEIVRQAEERVQNEVLAFCDPSNPIAWVTSVVARLIFCRIRLVIYHPPQYGERDNASPKFFNPEDHLRNAVQNLEYAHLLEIQPAAARFRWFTSTYVQWHALAATLAELCIQTQGPEVERAWRIVDLVFDRWAAYVVDSPNGRLWTPMKRLKSKADARRKEAVAKPSLDQQKPLPHFNTIGTSSELVNMQQYPTAMSMSMPGQQPPIFEQQIPSEFFASMNFDESLGEINWTEWDEFMHDFEIADGCGGGNVEMQPEVAQLNQAWW